MPSFGMLLRCPLADGPSERTALLSAAIEGRFGINTPKLSPAILRQVPPFEIHPFFPALVGQYLLNLPNSYCFRN